MQPNLLRITGPARTPIPINRLLPPMMGRMLEFVAADQIRRLYPR